MTERLLDKEGKCIATIEWMLTDERGKTQTKREYWIEYFNERIF